MRTTALTVPGAAVLDTDLFVDERGWFRESFRRDTLVQALQRRFEIVQVNTSKSRQRVLRGVHFSEVPIGQAKLVTVQQGEIADYVVDLRPGSPRYLSWDRIDVAAESGRSVFVPEGCGHAFVALTDTAVVTYLVTDVYRPEREHGVSPFDERLGIEWPYERSELILSRKDRDAGSVTEAESRGVFSTWETCQRHYESQAEGEGSS